MLEFSVIQTRGFRNVTDDGRITGFQVPVRLTGYRGAWLSQLRPATVTVDGVKYGGDQITWTVGGKTYEQSELSTRGDVHWSSLEPAILTMKEPGGLALGIHEVNVEFQMSSSYLPPRIDLRDKGGEPRTLVLVR